MGEPFYDYSSSMLEWSQKITNPKQKVASILRFFDADKDKRLNQKEVGDLWAASSDGAKLSEVQYQGACAMGGAEPKDGLDVEALAKLYADGFADLDDHFKVLQDLLVNKAKAKKPLKPVQENDEEDAEESEEEGDEDE